MSTLVNSGQNFLACHDMGRACRGMLLFVKFKITRACRFIGKACCGMMLSATFVWKRRMDMSWHRENMLRLVAHCQFAQKRTRWPCRDMARLCICMPLHNVRCLPSSFLFFSFFFLFLLLEKPFVGLSTHNKSNKNNNKHKKKDGCYPFFLSFFLSSHLFFFLLSSFFLLLSFLLLTLFFSNLF